MQKYGIEPPFVSQTQIELPNTLQECCEIAIAAEIDNIALYDNLLMHVNEPDVRDLFYRIQAASYNNHLPAFRNCVASYYNQNNQQNTGANMMDNMAQYQTLIEDAMSGNIDQNKIVSMLSNMNMSVISGLAVGALGGVTLSNLMNKEDINEEE
jgi:rubrerythrin